MKIKKANKAVSEIFGSILLLLLALLIMSLAYMYVLSYPLPDSVPKVEIVGSVDNRTRYMESLGVYKEYCRIIFTHRGGESLPLDSKFSIIIGDTVENTTVGDLLDSKSKEDRIWNIGERMIYTAQDITNKIISASIIDNEGNFFIFTAILQENTMVTTQRPFNIKHNASTLTMDYNFRGHGSGSVRFAYRNQSAESWTYTNWVSGSGADFYHKRVIQFSSETTYLYKAQLKYDSTIVGGNTVSFTTSESP